MEIVTERLKIKPLTKDIYSLIEKQGYKIGHDISLNIDKLIDNQDLFSWSVWFVIRKKDGKIIGDIGLKGKPNEKDVVEIGYCCLEEVWNLGYATESVNALINWAFSTSKVERIIAETLYDNIASMSVLEKLNFQKVDETETMVYWELNKIDKS